MSKKEDLINVTKIGSTRTGLVATESLSKAIEMPPGGTNHLEAVSQAIQKILVGQM